MSIYADIVGYDRPNRVGANYPMEYEGEDVETGGDVDALPVRQIQQRRFALRERKAMRIQEQWYGFPETEICSGETVRLRGVAENLMKITRVYLDDSVNVYLRVTELTISKNNLINGAGVSGTIFSPLAVTSYPKTATETIMPGCAATITITNKGPTKLCVLVSCDVVICW